MKKHNSGVKGTAELLLGSEERNKIVKLDEGYTIFKTIRNTPAYFESGKKDLLALVHQLGLPTLFYSLSAADTHSTPLIQSLDRIIDKKNHMMRSTLLKRCQQKINGNLLLAIQ